MRAVVLAVSSLVLGPSCGGPCREVETARKELLARTDIAPGAHARIDVPFALANGLIATQLTKEPELELHLDKLGPLEPYLPRVHARIVEVTLGPAPPGLVHFDARVRLDDDTGELMKLVAHADVTPVFDGHTLSIAIRADSLSRVEPELGPTAREHLTDAIVARMPQKAREVVPRIIVDGIAAKVAEQAAEQAYRLLRAGLLGRLGEITTIRVSVPALPVSTIQVASTTGAAPSLALGVVSTLPVRQGVRAPDPGDAKSDEIAIAITGSAVAEAANWSIAHQILPPRYSRGLAPEADGHYVPHFDWRADQPERPLVVHMFKLEDGCAHFVVGVKPFVELDGKGAVRYWVDNKSLESADASFGFEMLARINAVFESPRSGTKSAPGHVELVIAGRAVAGRLTRASIVDNEVHAGVALDIHQPI